MFSDIEIAQKNPIQKKVIRKKIKIKYFFHFNSIIKIFGKLLK